MSSYSQGPAQGEAYPPPTTAYPPPGVNYAYAAPPPAVSPPGYPVTGGAPYPQQQVPVKTKQRGEGFWKGCVAALCCCFLCEACCE